MSEYVIAYCYRSGEIGFAPPGIGIPDRGALFIASGRRDLVEPTIRGLARLSYDNSTYLVPGCGEAESEDVAYAAFMKFFVRVQTAMGKDANVSRPRNRRKRRARQ